MESSSTDVKLRKLYQAFSLLKDSEECEKFLIDLCTPQELQAMSDRLEVAELLAQELPYRTIAEQTKVSTTTITRVARCLTMGVGGYQLILKRLKRKSR